MYNQPIYSDDENALEKLQEKAVTLRATQEDMKNANAYFRKNGTMKGYGELTDEQAERIDTRILTGHSWDRQPYAAYKLQNNYQNLKRIEDRVKSLQRETNPEAAERVYDTEKYGFTVEENKEDMRLRLFFDGKPKEDTRNLLKQNGFKWSPTNECWQRLLNNNARYAVKYIVRQMEQQQKSGMEM